MGARELLDDLSRDGFSITADGDRLLVRPASKLTDDRRNALRAAKPELVALLAKPLVKAPDRPYRLAKAEGDAAHAVAWDDGAIARFVARVALLMRRGFNASDADDLAERLHLRDVQGDDRALCVECRHLTGCEAGRWRCGNARAAGVGRDLPVELATQLQRCAGFGEVLKIDGGVR